MGITMIDIYDNTKWLKWDIQSLQIMCLGQQWWNQVYPIPCDGWRCSIPYPFGLVFLEKVGSLLYRLYWWNHCRSTHRRLMMMSCLYELDLLTSRWRLLLFWLPVYWCISMLFWVYICIDCMRKRQDLRYCHTIMDMYLSLLIVAVMWRFGFFDLPQLLRGSTFMEVVEYKLKKL